MVNITFFEDTKGWSAPKRYMKYILVYCIEGNMTVVVDDKTINLKSNDVLTITSGQYHYFKNSSKVKGVILDFTLDFYCKSNFDIELIFENGLFCHFDRNEVIPMGNRQSVYEQLCMINEEINKQPYQFLTAIHARITLILTEINRAKIDQGAEIWKPDALFLKFLEMVRNNFHHNYSLQTLTDKLNTTVSKLNEQAKTYAGKTAQNVIYGLIISEAKRLLQYEKHLSVKEIAFKLGFNDPFYFSNFFKKHAKLSPKSFQKQFVK